MGFTPYEQTLRRLARFFDSEKSGSIPFQHKAYSLEPLRGYLAKQMALRPASDVFHVAGTKGKGSVTTLLEALLLEHGWTTGAYFSPHLVSYRERIHCNGAPIHEDDFSAFVNLALDEKPNPEGSPIRSVFEALTAAMALFFKKQRLQAAVLEVGLGGRLDATNVLETDVSVITPISLDHTEVLGASVSQIATEKAGILRPKQPAVVGRQPEDALQSILRCADEKHAKLLLLGQDFTVLDGQSAFGVQLWDGVVIPDLKTCMPGQFQKENVALALAAFYARFSFVDPDKARLAIARAKIRGRLEEIVLPDGCKVVLDGAHNPLAAKVLAQEINQNYGQETAMMLAVSSNKDALGMLKILLPCSKKIFATAFAGSRALPASDLDRLIQTLEGQSEVYAQACDAWEQWKSSRNKWPVLIVTGSLFLVGEILRLIQKEGWTALDPPPDPVFL